MSQGKEFLYHSIYIADSEGNNVKNTYKDWHLVTSVRPAIAPPEFRESYVEVPGSSVTLDMSDVLAGHPTYGMREGSIEFMVLNDYFTDKYTWLDIYSDMLNTIHGKKIQLWLEDDPGWYYTGRITLDEWETDQPYSTITFNYKLDPYKCSQSGGIYVVKCENGVVMFKFAKTPKGLESPKCEYHYIKDSKEASKLEHKVDGKMITNITPYISDEKYLGIAKRNVTCSVDIPRNTKVQSVTLEYWNKNSSETGPLRTLGSGSSNGSRFTQTLTFGGGDKPVEMYADAMTVPDSKMELGTGLDFVMTLQRPPKTIGPLTKQLNLVDSKDILTYFGKEPATMYITVFSTAALYGYKKLKLKYENKYYKNVNSEPLEGLDDDTEKLTDGVLEFEAADYGTSYELVHKVPFGKPKEWTGQEEENMISLTCIDYPEEWNKNKKDAVFTIVLSIRTDDRINDYYIDCGDGFGADFLGTAHNDPGVVAIRPRVLTAAINPGEDKIGLGIVNSYIVQQNYKTFDILIDRVPLTQELNLTPSPEKYLTVNEIDDAPFNVYNNFAVLGEGSDQDLIFTFKNKYYDDNPDDDNPEDENDVNFKWTLKMSNDYLKTRHVKIGKPEGKGRIEDPIVVNCIGGTIYGGKFPDDVNFTVTLSTIDADRRL